MKKSSCLLVKLLSRWSTFKKVLEDGHLSQKMREKVSAFMLTFPISLGNPQESPWRWPLVLEDEGEVSCLFVMFQSRWATLKKVLEDGHLCQKLREKAAAFVWCSNLVWQPSRKSLNMATCPKRWGRRHLHLCDLSFSLGNPQESPWRWPLVSKDEGEPICLGHISQKMRERASSLVWHSNLVGRLSRKSLKMATCLKRWGRRHLPSCDVPISLGNPQESRWRWPLVSEDEGEGICLHVMFKSRWATLKKVVEDGHLSQKMREKASAFVWRSNVVGQPSRKSLKVATCL